MSPEKRRELKEQEEFKFYDNTNMYVTFRKNYIEGSGKGAARPMFKQVVMDELKDDKNAEELKKYSVDIGLIKLKMSFAQYIIIEVGRTLDHATISRILAKRPEILAVEFLNKKIKYGANATLDEMTSFKSKVKKIDPETKLETKPDVKPAKQVIDMSEDQSPENQAEQLHNLSD
jgi:hypothetical protein